MQFATNHMGHFALANGLHDALAADADARVAVVASQGHLISGVSHFDHPVVGPMSLEFERLAVAGTSGQLIVVYHAAPGSTSAQKPADLGAETAARSARR